MSVKNKVLSWKSYHKGFGSVRFRCMFWLGGLFIIPNWCRLLLCKLLSPVIIIGDPNPIPPIPSCSSYALLSIMLFFNILKFLSFDLALNFVADWGSFVLSFNLYIFIPSANPIFSPPNLSLILLVYSSALIKATSAITAFLLGLTLIPSAAKYPGHIGSWST